MHRRFVLPSKFGQKLSDRIGMIIWCDHVVGDILHLTRSDGSILIGYRIFYGTRVLCE